MKPDSSGPDELAAAAADVADAIGRMIDAAVAAALAGHHADTGEPRDRPKLLTYKQASLELNISTSMLYRLLRDGEISNVCLAPQVRRITATEIDRYIAARIEQAGSAD